MTARETHMESVDQTTPAHRRVMVDEFWGTGWDCPPGWHKDEESQTALKHLGPLPFSRGAVPLMGILASLYEHVSTSAQTFLANSSECSVTAEK